MGATLFFLLWLAIPSVILIFIARDAWKNARTWRWPATECTILGSSVDDTNSDENYAFRVEYAYATGAAADLEPRPMISTVYARNYKGAGDYAEAGRLLLRYPAGSKATCYVNPEDPGEAVLKRNSLAPAAMMLVPLLFIVIGVGGLWFTWRPGSAAAPASGTRGDGPLSSGPLSKAPSKQTSPWIAVAFFAAFGGCGGIALVAIGGRTLNVFTARSWSAVPATVVSSRVRSHSGDDSTTYSVDVLYRYDVNEREYRSNRYGFMGGSSSGYDGKREIVSRFPPGARVTAYVNPADPTDAVLERGFTLNMLFLLIPLVFLAIGAGGMFYAVRGASRRRLESQLRTGGGPNPAAGAGASPFGRDGRTYVPRRMSPAGGGPVALKPRQSPVVKLVAITFGALFWNGIVAVFLAHVVGGWRTGHVDACLTVFLVPFVAVGVVLIGGVCYALLGLSNPRVVLVLDRAELAPGEPAELRWSLTGNPARVHRLVLSLQGREEATYRQGTDTHTDKHTFATLELADVTRAADIRAGRAAVAVPADTMHSFEAANNKIVWVLVAHGHVRGWPDVKEEYVVTVAPSAAAPAGLAGPAPSGPAEPREASWTN